MRTRYAAVILAAGYSSRMGAFKPLIKLEGTTIADRLIGLYRDRGIDVYLVVGYQKEKLQADLVNTGLTLVENPCFAEGMFSSVQAGVKASSAQTYQALFIHPVDIPLVRPATIESLISSDNGRPGSVLYPAFDGRRGHPALIASEHVGGILKWPGDGGLKKYLLGQEDQAHQIELADSNVLFDIDLPDDLIELNRRLGYLSVPDEIECSVILQRLHPVSKLIQDHCLAVAKLALQIAQALDATGYKIDLKLVQAAAMLHDLAKGQPEHEQVGAELVNRLGFPAVGHVIACHSEIKPDSASLESKVLFITDKYIQQDHRFPLASRFEKARAKFGNSQDALAGIQRREEQAFNVKHELEKYLGYPLEEIVDSA